MNVLKLCGIFGLVPFSKKYTRGTFLYSSFVVIVLNVVNVLCFYTRTRRYDLYKTAPLIVDVASWILQSMLLNAFFITLYKRTSWDVLMNDVQKTEITTLKRDVDECFQITWDFWLELFTPIVLFLIETIPWMWEFNDAANVWINCSAYLPLRLVKLYKIMISRLIYLYINMVLSQYKFVVKQLSEINLNNFDTLIIKEVDRYANLYAVLYGSIDKFNCLFNWVIFLLFVDLVGGGLELFASFVYSIPFWDTRLLGIYISSALHLLLDLVLTLHIVLPADKIEKCSQILDKTIHELILGKLSNSPLKQEFLAFSQSVKVLAPRISAAGFYNVNRGVLLGLASVMTTYFIVYLQFK